MSHNVFVYGTLKHGEPNHSWLTRAENGRSRFVCEAITSKKYPLIIATRYNIPFLLHQPGVGHFVQGEVYEVDSRMLTKLDILEDHPNYYVRSVDVIHPKGCKPTALDCWVYFLHQFKPRLLDLPMLENYSSTGDHGLVYAERSARDPSVAYIHEVR